MKTRPLVCLLASLLPLSGTGLVAASPAPAAPPVPVAANQAPIVMAPFVVNGNTGISFRVTRRPATGGEPSVIDEPLITQVVPGSPADRAGVTVGDTIAQIDDVKLQGLEAQRWRAEFGAGRPEKPIVLLIRKAGTQKMISLKIKNITPRKNTPQK